MVKKKSKSEVENRKLIAFTNPRSRVSEQFRTLRTNIHFTSPDGDIRSLVITSASHSEGKSTTASNLAIVFAQEGKRVLFIDADMRKPTMHHTFKINNSRGLSNVLARQIALKVAIQPAEIENLDLLPCGPIPPNPAELLSSQNMDLLFEQALDVYDLLIFDTPPVLSVTDSVILANKCEGTILVINSGKTERDHAIKAKEAITASTKTRLLGAVINNVKVQKDTAYAQYYGADG
ncbi:CpsD/CapB family tyrosine-protein kinase [Microbacterium sp. APC 3898]|jgi:capsular exopolysaccharide synthesis family protein|uniref:non-specific protein-tyrosine kinase n=1 Tax=Planococcus notacanthi TaxID=3035188 RepID=A0ABT7ZFC6_9BACL|nr:MULTISPECIES: CpsD/CapB family tyrosine-protein kinase [Terrabacteria group]MBF6634897.1 CpsD/CapB family tyrosine-protein kinase [Planococcus sp. (in: firmicutes)]MDN3425777.1 CpsD/CapB family tyrosine-protein kinase [Planococcus sp. APC 4016]MDN3437371.1 CpsD/CapB family tyrosine-protein kinase [Planococcus sp. APC 3900]MDN3500591.1 CpsD/CapB family tyrosine-protein kinase [Microbacterium sp. APC 3898]